MAIKYLGKTKLRQFFIDHIAEYFPEKVPKLKYCDYEKYRGTEWLKIRGVEYDADITFDQGKNFVRTMCDIRRDYKTVKHVVDYWRWNPETQETGEHTYNSIENQKRLDAILEELEQALEKMNRDMNYTEPGKEQKC